MGSWDRQAQRDNIYFVKMFFKGHENNSADVMCFAGKFLHKLRDLQCFGNFLWTNAHAIYEKQAVAKGKPKPE